MKGMTSFVVGRETKGGAEIVLIAQHRGEKEIEIREFFELTKSHELTKTSLGEEIRSLLEEEGLIMTEPIGKMKMGGMK